MPRRDFLGVESSLNPEGDLGLAPQWLPEKGFLNARGWTRAPLLFLCSNLGFLRWSVGRSVATFVVGRLHASRGHMLFLELTLHTPCVFRLGPFRFSGFTRLLFSCPRVP